MMDNFESILRLRSKFFFLLLISFLYEETNIYHVMRNFISLKKKKKWFDGKFFKEKYKMRERALYKISVQFPLLLGANIYSCEKTDEESICTDLGPNQVQFLLFSRNFWQTQYVSFESYKTDTWKICDKTFPKNHYKSVGKKSCENRSTTWFRSWIRY